MPAVTRSSLSIRGGTLSLACIFWPLFLWNPFLLFIESLAMLSPSCALTFLIPFGQHACTLLPRSGVSASTACTLSSYTSGWPAVLAQPWWFPAVLFKSSVSISFPTYRLPYLCILFLTKGGRQGDGYLYQSWECSFNIWRQFGKTASTPKPSYKTALLPAFLSEQAFLL